MCVLLIHHRVRSDWPLVLLANRDERYDRPFDPPSLRDPASGAFAPTDRRGRGTWIGRNRHGLVAAITNRRGEEAPPEAPSRGLLVLAALAEAEASDAVRVVVRRLAEVAQGGFHLLLADRRRAFVVRHRGAATASPPRPGDLLALEPGAHLLTNLHELDELEVPPEGRPDPDEPIASLVARLERLAIDSTPSLPGGHRILKRAADRGTVASAVIAIPAAPGDAGLFRFAAGPPDRVPFVDHAP